MSLKNGFSTKGIGTIFDDKENTNEFPECYPEEKTPRVKKRIIPHDYADIEEEREKTDKEKK